MYFFIYKTVNLINKKFYIGKHITNSIDDNYLGSGVILNHAIKKYGRENFKRFILHFCKDKEELDLKEKEILSIKFISENKNICYNISTGGKGGDTFTLNPNLSLIKEKISKGCTGCKRGPMSLESRIKKSKSLKGRIMSEETRKRMKENHANVYGNKNPNYGNKYTDDCKRKIGEKSIGRMKGKIWINNGIISKRIYKEELNNFTNWKLGRNKFKPKNPELLVL